MEVIVKIKGWKFALCWVGIIAFCLLAWVGFAFVVYWGFTKLF